jgi:two-component system phosphate regulon sensor histidine kinase PhoR
LGLAITKHVMQRHGGELRIESVVGQGSTFRLVFPQSRVVVTHAESA